MELHNRKITEINTAAYNPRVITKEELDGLRASIKEFGLVQPYVVNIRPVPNILISGHQRLKIDLEKNAAEIPCIHVDLSPTKEKALNIALNSQFISGKFDDVKLGILLAEIKIDLPEFSELRLDEFEITPEIIEGQCDPDDVPEFKKDPITKRGDVWLVGKHRLMCGDSTVITDVEKLMNRQKTDMVFTDPPYGMNLDTDYSKMAGKGNKYQKVIGDDGEFDAQSIIPFFEYCKEIFLWGADYYVETIHRTHENLGSWVVWDKYPTDGNGKRFGSAFETCWSRQKHKREICRVKSINVNHQTVKEKEDHPTQKPVGLVEWFFERWANGLTVVADLFLGSGSTLIACEKTNRVCYGMEIDEQYCDVIINRYLKFTGRDDVTLESTGEKYSVLSNLHS